MYGDNTALALWGMLTVAVLAALTLGPAMIGRAAAAGLSP